MQNYSVYLAGGMQGLTMEEQLVWRNKATEYLQNVECDYKVSTINPPTKYNFYESKHLSEREIMEYDLYKLRNSDLVLVSFNNPNSIGTACELMLSKELHIPVIGIYCGKEIHPWLKECCTRICVGLDDALRHVEEFYLQ